MTDQDELGITVDTTASTVGLEQATDAIPSDDELESTEPPDVPVPDDDPEEPDHEDIDDEEDDE